MEFKKGDKVRVIDASPSTHNGESGTFDKIEDEGYIVILNSGSPWFCDEIESLLDKREEAIYKRLCGIKRPRPKGVFKVGDKVRIIKNNGGSYYDQFTGKIKEVIKVSYDGDYITVNIPSEDGGGNASCARDELELVEAVE